MNIEATSSSDDRRWIRATGSALCAMLIGLGLARFAYGPLMPALIEARWFSPAEAAYLGAANLAGYLVGAVAGRPLAARVPPRVVLRAMMALVASSFLACAAPLWFAWFLVWRFASGVAGGALMVLAAPAVLPVVPINRRGIASGLIFTGVGLGIAASGSLTPVLLSVGLGATWLAFGVLCIALTVLAWCGWPAETAAPMRPQAAPAAAPSAPGAARPLYVSYGLVAAGLVPHMVFLVDFVARGLALGIGFGAVVWTLFGVGAVFGPMLAGRVADRIGFAPSLRGAILLLFACNVWLAVSPGLTALVVSSLLCGAFVPGITSLALGRIYELVPSDPAARTHAWSIATIAFAILQAAGAYGLSVVFSATAGAYAPLFWIAAAAAGLAFVIEIVGTYTVRRAQAEPAAKAEQCR
jgi:predicted MFS family arabinose efflux permease